MLYGVGCSMVLGALWCKVLGALWCWVLYGVGCSIVLGALWCWVLYGVGCFMVLSVLLQYRTSVHSIPHTPSSPLQTKTVNLSQQVFSGVTGSPKAGENLCEPSNG